MSLSIPLEISPYSSWGEGGSRSIRKKLKWEAQLICNIRIDRMIGSSI